MSHRLEVGQVFEGRAVENDRSRGDGDPISWEHILHPGIRLPAGADLARYGRVFRTEIRLIEEITDSRRQAVQQVRRL